MITATGELIFWAVTAIIAGAGAYFGAYLKKKGENLATHEDLNRLVKQMEATTEAAKRIEARISNEVWDRQKHWELKRDTVISIVQTMNAAKDALMMYAARLQSVTGAGIDAHRFESVMTASALWTEQITKFDAERAVAALICSGMMNDALLNVQKALRLAFSDLADGRASTYDEVGGSVRDRFMAAIAISRDELGIRTAEANRQPTST